MRQQERTEYTPGTIVFAKLKGYPWWPARIEADHAVPPKVLKQKSKAKGALYTVFFYGSRDYGFFGPDAIRPFDSEIVENDLKAKKFKTKDLEMAVRQALNPALLEQIEREEAEAEAEEEEHTNKRKNNTKKTAANGKRKSTTRKMAVEDEDESIEDRKRRRKSMSLEKEEDVRNSPQMDKEELKKTPEYKRVYHIRHRLQRLVYNKKEGEIPKEDYPKILQVIKEIEEAPMTYNLLKDTKIGKVVKAACSYPFENESTIKERCQQIMRSWKSLLIDPQTGSSLTRKSSEDNNNNNNNSSSNN
ncbi:uncharacterized protein BX663DRAFT_524602 [Cokeromyces recurvatus]|uniref:uncharacterized protein n=1 Tax=Cokeromyces recurvatus TaxID=90255 RepID=UPI00221F6DFB|nr:uncharacterized protein BX663DRAFT_524602 [Cokeromyces recurvatus]KAI7898563.1 hypothetical protein BX663DRAFT_524602 [Cokeromyces recurvatus]